MQKNISRRSFIQTLLGSAALLPLLAVEKLFAVNLKTLPAGAKALAETAPLAKVLGYKQDATKADKVKYKKYAAGQMCSNCAQFVKQNDDWGTCKVLAGGSVSSGGWCSSYLAKKA